MWSKLWHPNAPATRGQARGWVDLIYPAFETARVTNKLPSIREIRKARPAMDTELEDLISERFTAAAIPSAVFYLVDAEGRRLAIEHGGLSVTTPVMLGSTSKAMTATLLLQLVDQGLLSLEDPATQYLPEVNLPPDVTLSDLAHHTSGLRPDAYPERYKPRARRAFTYANQNYNFLGDTIAAVTGTPFSRVLTERLLRPLGMTRSGCAPERRGTRGRTSFLGIAYPALRYNFGPRSWIQAPSGGIVSTAEDAGKFLSMLLNNGCSKGCRILSEEAVSSMFDITTPANNSPAVSDSFSKSGSYGLGWVRKSIEGHQVYSHTGKLPHASSVFKLIPELELGFVLLADIGDFLVRTPLLEDLANDITRILLGQPATRISPPSSARKRQLLLGLTYLGLLAGSAAGWSKHTRPRSMTTATLFHAVLPTTLLAGFRKASGTPWPWMLRFAPDTVAVLTLGCLNLLVSGLGRLWAANLESRTRHRTVAEKAPRPTHSRRNPPSRDQRPK